MLSLFALIACSGSATTPEGVITLVYSHNVDGEIEPCG